MSPQHGDAARRPLSELSSNAPLTSSFSDTKLTRATSSTSPHLVQAVLANTRRRDQLPIEENISITRRSQPLIIGGRSWKPSLPTLESHSLPAEKGPIALAMARDLSHESTTSVQTEPAEQISNSISDEYLTPLMSPVEQRPLPLPLIEPDDIRGRERLPSINTSNTSSLRANPPYPLANSPDTEPLPILVPESPGREGPGVGLGIRGPGQDTGRSR